MQPVTCGREAREKTLKRKGKNERVLQGGASGGVCDGGGREKK